MIKLKKTLLKILIPAIMLVFLVGGVIAYTDPNIFQEDTEQAQVTIPSLTDSEKELAKEIVEKELADLLKDKEYKINEVGVSHQGSEKLGAFVWIEFKDIYWMTVKSGDWEHTGWVDGLAVDVDLERKTVRGVMVAPSRYTIGKKVDITVEQIRDERFKKATEIVLRSQKVKKMTAGRSFKVIPDSCIKQGSSEYITLFIAMDENGKEKRSAVLVKNGKVYLESEVIQNEE
ncbi:MAG: hypothetical protein DRN88_01470 [Candidatus Hydrothermarchaeota archaeon]|nr:MAG: hypothetical protein DRN88_01470 [Candidatus Hydrothermarchaeota archaeon]